MIVLISHVLLYLHLDYSLGYGNIVRTQVSLATLYCKQRCFPSATPTQVLLPHADAHALQSVFSLVICQCRVCVVFEVVISLTFK